MRAAVALLACGLVCGCGGVEAYEDDELVVADGEDLEDFEAAEDALEIPFTPVEGFLVPSNIGTGSTRRLFKSARAFQSFFGVPAPADIDFSRRWVAFYSAGMKRTGGYTASFTSVSLTPSRYLKIRTQLSQPGRGCMVPQAITRPMAMISFAIPSQTPRRTNYTGTTHTRDCTQRGCEVVRCAQGTYCDDTTGRAQCLAYETCATVLCPGRTRCEDRPIQCIRAPCPPSAPVCVE